MINRLSTQALAAALVSVAAMPMAAGQTASPVATPHMKPPADGKPHHLAYEAATDAELELFKPGPTLGNVTMKKCRLQAAVIEPLRQLLQAAQRATQKDEWQLVTLSCFRSINYQAAVFCNHDGVTGKDADDGKDCVDPAVRSRMSAPPGFSEHATGFALDFTVRGKPGENIDCGRGGSPCAKEMETAAGKWLMKNAACYGFELSFPGDRTDESGKTSEQSVAYEPWHWRWAGLDPGSDAAKHARDIFADARAWYPNQAPACPAAAFTN
jgi:D-alanyl-D-alanine carboxypeptidase